MRSALRATAPTAKSNWARAMRIVIPDSLASSRAHVAHGLLDHLRVDAARLERLGPARGRVGGQVLGLVAAQAFAAVGLEQGHVARHARTGAMAVIESYPSSWNGSVIEVISPPRGRQRLAVVVRPQKSQT